jgi:hypothetical protein
MQSAQEDSHTRTGKEPKPKPYKPPIPFPKAAASHHHSIHRCIDADVVICQVPEGRSLQLIVDIFKTTSHKTLRQIFI